MHTFEGPPLTGAEGIGALTLGGFLDEVVDRFGPRQAVVGDGERWTYAELRSEARRVGRGLATLGVAPGDAVGILMGNRPEAVASLFGAALAGAAAVPMSTFAAAPERAFMVERSGAAGVLTQERLLDRRPADDLAALRWVNPELTDGAYYGPSRGHLQPRWARHVGMPRGYGYGASMGAWILDYVAAWAGEWGFVVHSSAQYRNPAFTGDVTRLTGEVVGTRTERRRHLVAVRVELHNQDGAVMAKATADVELPKE